MDLSLTITQQLNLNVCRSIYETTCRLQRLMEIYQDRICFLAGEENGLGRFLKEHGKSDKTRAEAAQRLINGQGVDQEQLWPHHQPGQTEIIRIALQAYQLNINQVLVIEADWFFAAFS